LSLSPDEFELLSRFYLFSSEEDIIEEVMTSLWLIPPNDCLRNISSLALTFLIFLSLLLLTLEDSDDSCCSSFLALDPSSSFYTMARSLFLFAFLLPILLNLFPSI